jgi:hypothetical protein
MSGPGSTGAGRQDASLGRARETPDRARLTHHASPRPGGNGAAAPDPGVLRASQLQALVTGIGGGSYAARRSDIARLQRTAGNRATTSLVTDRIGRPGPHRAPVLQRAITVQRRPAHAPVRAKHKPADAAQLLANAYPNLTIAQEQIAKLQAALDARAAIQEINEDPVWGSILSSDRPKQEALEKERFEWQRDDIRALNVATQQVLSDDILRKGDDERARREAQFREQLYATMLSYPVKIPVKEGELAPSLGPMTWGPANWVLGHDGGKVSFVNLLAIEKFKLAYDKAITGDEIESKEGLLELLRHGLPYDQTGKKVGETFGYTYNSTFKVGPELGDIGGYVDDARGRIEMAGVKGGGGQIVLRNPKDNFLHVYQLSLKSTDLRYYDKKVSGNSATGMAFLYNRGSEVGGTVDEIMTSDGAMLVPGGDSYGQGWGTSAVLNEYEKFAMGAILGDAFEDGDAVMTFGQIVVGCIPVVGQIADARDVVVGIHKMWSTGRKDGKLQTALALVGFIPFIGDGIKAAWKAGRRAITGPMTKAAAKGLGVTAVKTGAKETAGSATKQLGERILRNADEVAEFFKVDVSAIRKMAADLDELAAKAAKGGAEGAKAAREYAEALLANLNALGGNAGSLVGSMGGSWVKVAKTLTRSPEGAQVGQLMETWRKAQFANLEKAVAGRAADLGAEFGSESAPKMVRTGTEAFTSDVDISFLGPLSTQHRNAAIRQMEAQFGPGWRKLLDADIFADPARLHLFEDPLKKLGGKAGREAGGRIVKEAEVNTFAKMLKDGVPIEEVRKLAASAGVDMAEITARQKELTKLSTDYLANELRKGTPREEVEKLAGEMGVTMADVDKHLAGGDQLYREMELKLDALHSQFMAAKGNIAEQARLGEEMAALQGKLNAAIPGPYMTPGGGAKHVSRRERKLRPDGSYVPMSPIMGYMAVIDDLYMLMHAVPGGEFTEKSAKGMAKYGDRLLVTAGQFGVEIKGSTRALFDDIAGLLERARLQGDQPALEKAIPLLESAKGQLKAELGDIVAGVKKEATEFLKEPAYAPTYAGFTEKTLAALATQSARVESILLRKPQRPEDQAPEAEPKPEEGSPSSGTPTPGSPAQVPAGAPTG